MKTMISRTTLRHHRPGTRPDANDAFTRIELLVLLASVGLLMSLALPILAGTHAGSASTACLNNLRRLGQAWLLFIEDHDGFFPGNVDDGSTQGYNWVGGQASVGGSQEFNPEVLQNPASSQLANYVGREAEPFRCPADLRIGRYRGTDPALQGLMVPAARSYAMNGAVGTQKDGLTPVDGLWLDGNHAHQRNGPWRTYGRLADLIDPAPAELHHFIGEDAYSINDGSFSLSMRAGTQAEWIDWPGTRHDFGAGVGFADGRAEIHRWEDSRTTVTTPLVGRRIVPDSPDVAWLQTRTSVLAR